MLMASGSLICRTQALNGSSIPFWSQRSKTRGQVRDPHLSNCLCWVSHPPSQGTHVVSTRGSHLSPRGAWGLTRGSPSPISLPPPPPSSHSPTGRKRAEQLIFMNRNSIRRRFLWAWGGGENRERRTKGPLYYLPRAGNCCSPPAAAGAAFIVLTHLRVKSYCALSLLVWGGLCAGRSPPWAPPTALIGC